MKKMSAPEQYDRVFLEWVKEKTESAWQKDEEWDSLIGELTPLNSWQKDSRWTGGLTNAEIRSAEEKWGLKFPDDLKLFLQTLGTVDKPLRVIRYKGEDPVEVEIPSFYDWRTDEAAIQDAYDAVEEGLIFDVENNNLWMDSWGEKPSAESARANRVRELIAAAPLLIPLFQHRFLLAEPNQPGNPVFSIMQSDIIVYGPDLKTYLMAELQSLTRYDPVNELNETYADRVEDIFAVPFWGELYRRNLENRQRN
jgi:hypothetical protein